MGTAATVVRPEKAVATVALVGVDKATAVIIAESFRLFGIQSISLVGDEVARLEREKFHACALPLDADAEGVLKRVRGSASNRHIVLYGICSSLQEAMRYSGYGINAIFEHPVDRHAALRVVRFTYLLVVHELRRYVRVPLLCEALLERGKERVHASTVELSGGGMSLRTPPSASFTVAQPVQVTFELPNVGQISLHAIVAWIRHEEEMVGVRFEPLDELRPVVRRWIDDYLEI